MSDQILELKSSIDKLQRAGLVLSVDGAPISEADAIRDDSVLAVKLGIGSTSTASTSPAYLIAIETPDPLSVEYDALASAIAGAGCSRIFDKLHDGWSERTPAGRVVSFARMEAASDDHFKMIVRSLPSRRATAGDIVLAEIRFSQTLTVLPTQTVAGRHELNDGRFASPVVLTATDLLRIAVVIDESSDSRDALARGRYDIRDHDAGTNSTRDRFDRAQQLVDVERLLDEGGWTMTSADPSLAHYERAGRSGHLIRANLMFVDGGEARETLAGAAAVLSPFDLVAAKHLNPEAAGQWLVDQGAVTTELAIFSARGEIPRVNRAAPTLEIITEWSEHIRQARSKFDAATPLAFQRTRNGNFQSLISIAPGGAVVRWESRKARNLLVASCQLVEVRKIDDAGLPVYKNFHEVPETIVDGVMTALEGPAALSQVEYLGTEPLITREGLVVQANGFDLSAKAFLSIPHRERAAWKAGYHVNATPTLAEAQAAFDLVNLELLAGFSYTTSSDRAKHFLYLLTAAGRTLTTGSPAFLANAPDRGTGKTLCLLIGRVLAQGNAASQGFYFGLVNDLETQKGLAAALRSERTFMHCDEVPRGDTMKSIVVTEAITGVDGDAEIRILGVSETVTRSGLIFTAAGCAVETGGDLNRRFLTINLRSRTEEIPPRNKDLIGFINRNRPRLLAALHTILLFGLQNPPAHETRSMSFSHDWEEKILGAATHIVDTDGRTIAEAALDGWHEDVAAVDELGQEWGQLLAHLWKRSNGKPTTAAELVAHAKISNYSAGETRPELPSNLIGVLGEDSGTSARWAKELKSIHGATIPHDGANYQISVVGRAGRTNRARQYQLRCFNDNGIVLPGRDPAAVHEVMVAENADEVAALEFS